MLELNHLGWLTNSQHSYKRMKKVAMTTLWTTFNIFAATKVLIDSFLKHLTRVYRPKISNKIKGDICITLFSRCIVVNLKCWYCYRYTN